MTFDGHGPSILPATMLSYHLRERFAAVPIEYIAKRRVSLVEPALRVPRRTSARHPRPLLDRRREVGGDGSRRCVHRDRSPDGQGRTVSLNRRDVARLIVRRDRAFREVVRLAGPPPARRSSRVDERFAFLVRSIVFQLLATSAADTIHARVIETCGGSVDVTSILDTGAVELEGCGPLAHQGRSNDRPRRARERRTRAPRAPRLHVLTTRFSPKSPRCAVSARGRPTCIHAHHGSPRRLAGRRLRRAKWLEHHSPTRRDDQRTRPRRRRRTFRAAFVARSRGTAGRPFTSRVPDNLLTCRPHPRRLRERSPGGPHHLRGASQPFSDVRRAVGGPRPDRKGGATPRHVGPVAHPSLL